MDPLIRNNVLKTSIGFVFVVYLLTLVKFILIKQPGELKDHFTDSYSLELLKTNLSNGNYMPFYTVKYYVTGTDPGQYSKENLVGNIILFIPLGILLPLLFRKMANFQKVVSTALLISLAFELIQLFTVLGNFDVDDIILNILGSTIGFVLYRSLLKYIEKKIPHNSE